LGVTFFPWFILIEAILVRRKARSNHRGKQSGHPLSCSRMAARQHKSKRVGWGRIANSVSAINICGPSLARFLIMGRTALTNLPRRGFFLEITKLLNVEVLARLLGSSRASVPQDAEARKVGSLAGLLSCHKLCSHGPHGSAYPHRHRWFSCEPRQCVDWGRLWGESLFFKGRR
jgi:hypothetical protein